MELTPARISSFCHFLKLLLLLFLQLLLLLLLFLQLLLLYLLLHYLKCIIPFKALFPYNWVLGELMTDVLSEMIIKITLSAFKNVYSCLDTNIYSYL
jgi:hypothetical protein